MSSTARFTLAAVLGLAALAVGTAAAPAVAQDYNAGAIKIEAPWLRATPSGAQVAGAYMKLHNTGSEPDRLVGGSSPIAGAFEVHEMHMKGDVMMMRELADGLVLPPGQTVELKPGSYHIMLTDLKQPLKAGDKIKGTLQFEKAGKVEVEYTVRGMGSQGPGGSGDHGSGMKH
jgi:periplasmic copper chaperone A